MRFTGVWLEKMQKLNCCEQIWWPHPQDEFALKLPNIISKLIQTFKDQFAAGLFDTVPLTKQFLLDKVAQPVTFPSSLSSLKPWLRHQLESSVQLVGSFPAPEPYPGAYPSLPMPHESQCQVGSASLVLALVLGWITPQEI